MNERIMFVWKETSIRERPILKKLLSIVAVCFVFFMAVSMSCFCTRRRNGKPGKYFTMAGTSGRGLVQH